MARLPKPISATLRAYPMGSGCCLLLTIHYSTTPGEDDRHVLIDFGSLEVTNDRLRRIAEDIEAVCRGKLSGVVATDWYKISGLATNKKRTGPGDIIARCNPSRVVQLWAEDPKAKPNARKPTQRLSPNKSCIALKALRIVSETVLREIREFAPALPEDLRKWLRFWGDSSLRNLSAIRNLNRMGRVGKTRYENHIANSSLVEILPGVKVRLLAPSNLKRSGPVRGQRPRQRFEDWQAETPTPKILPEAELYGDSRPPQRSRWVIRRMKNLRAEQLLELITKLHQLMEEMSIIPLFEIGRKKQRFDDACISETFLTQTLKGNVLVRIREIDL